MTNEQEIYYAIKEAISVMTQYDTGEDFALVSALNRLHGLEQKLQQHSVGGPASASALDGEQLGNEAGDTVAVRGSCGGR